MNLILYLLIGVIALIYYWVKKQYSYWTDRGFLSLPASFPFGSMKDVGTKITTAEAMDIFYRKLKGKAPAFGMFLFLKPTLMVTDPELLKNVLVRDFSSFHDRGMYFNKEDDPTSANLLSLQGQEWRERRVKLTPIFTSGKMKMMFETVSTIGDKLVNVINEKLKESKALEMRELVSEYTADVIGNVAFGLDCKCLENPNSEFFKHARRMFNLTPFELIKFMFSMIFPDIARRLHFRQTPKEPTEFFLNTFLQTFEHREKNNIKRNDFVSLLLDLKDSFTPVELAAESVLVYSGGFDTSSTLLTFALYELAMSPEIQERLRDEIRLGLSENDGILTYEILFGFKYLDMVINECLRKYPPIPTGGRTCTKDYPIPGTNLVIPKGTPVTIAFFSFHRDPEHYPDPDRFDPERFTPENIKERTPFTFLPFGEGPHNCIGMRFALMQSKLAVLKVLQHFEVCVNEKTSIPMEFVPSSPFLAPVGGMWLNLKKIT